MGLWRPPTDQPHLLDWWRRLFLDPLPDIDDVEPPAEQPRPTAHAHRQRGHLTVHDGGRSLAG